MFKLDREIVEEWSAIWILNGDGKSSALQCKQSTLHSHRRPYIDQDKTKQSKVKSVKSRKKNEDEIVTICSYYVCLIGNHTE